eukprot:COSAG05_NODE_1658_length_4325_cov_6.217700_2_plen_232_part_00
MRALRIIFKRTRTPWKLNRWSQLNLRLRSFGVVCSIWQQNALIEVLDRASPGDGWWTGRLQGDAAGKIGIFPSEYVAILQPGQGRGDVGAAPDAVPAPEPQPEPEVRGMPVHTRHTRVHREKERGREGERENMDWILLPAPNLSVTVSTAAPAPAQVADLNALLGPPPPPPPSAPVAAAPTVVKYTVGWDFAAQHPSQLSVRSGESVPTSPLFLLLRPPVRRQALQLSARL